MVCNGWSATDGLHLFCSGCEEFLDAAMLRPNPIYTVRKRRKPQFRRSTEHHSMASASRRHRERMNVEFERLASVLPFPSSLSSRLDKLSVLRLAVGYLRSKSYFKTALSKSPKETKNGLSLSETVEDISPAAAHDNGFLEEELVEQILNGFLIVITDDGLIFYVSAAVQDVLGFLQTDLLHQNALELVHLHDREMFWNQLNWTHCFIDKDGCAEEACCTEEQKNLVLEMPALVNRNFNCKMRCLLDNSAGFLTMQVNGNLKLLPGQMVKGAAQLALFAIVTPLQVPAITELYPRNAMFCSKHKLDSTLLDIDTKAVPLHNETVGELPDQLVQGVDMMQFILQELSAMWAHERPKMVRYNQTFGLLNTDGKIISGAYRYTGGRYILGWTVEELRRNSGYHYVHTGDLFHCAEYHIKLMKTGESGWTIFRLLHKNQHWVWVRATARLVYKNGQADCIISTQQLLTNSEGEQHLAERASSFNNDARPDVLYDTSIRLHRLTKPNLHDTNGGFHASHPEAHANQNRGIFACYEEMNAPIGYQKETLKYEGYGKEECGFLGSEGIHEMLWQYDLSQEDIECSWKDLDNTSAVGRRDAINSCCPMTEQVSTGPPCLMEALLVETGRINCTVEGHMDLNNALRGCLHSGFRHYPSCKARATVEWYGNGPQGSLTTSYELEERFVSDQIKVHGTFPGVMLSSSHSDMSWQHHTHHSLDHLIQTRPGENIARVKSENLLECGTYNQNLCKTIFKI